MYARKILLKSDNIFFEKYEFDLWPKLPHNVTTLDNDDIDMSKSHVLLFSKIFNVSVQIGNNRYPATLLYLW